MRSTKAKERVMVSAAFIQAVRSYPESNHVLAVKAGVTPAFLSYILNGVMTVYPGDLRVRKIARIIKFTGECFEIVKG